MKNQLEPPFTFDGRQLYTKRIEKRLRKPRDDDLLADHTNKILEEPSVNNNFEYILNCGYAVNRDRYRCRICGKPISKETVHLHRIIEHLPLDKINRVPNSATIHWKCHEMIHDLTDYSHLGTNIWKKITKFRENLHKK
jgi:hypothetical protein